MLIGQKGVSPMQQPIESFLVCQRSCLLIIINQKQRKKTGAYNEGLYLNQNNLINRRQKISSKNRTAFAFSKYKRLQLRKNNMHNPSSINCSMQCDYLPINLEVQLKDFSQIGLNISHQTLVARHKGESINMPVHAQRLKWMRVNFGQEIKKAALKMMDGSRKNDRRQVYTDHQSWKQQQKQQVQNSYHISMQSIILLLKSKTEKLDRKSEIHYKNSISGFMKSKFSERGNQKSHNAIVKRSQHIILNKQEQDRKQTSTIAPSRTRRHDSQTLELESLIQDERSKDRRDSNVSTSIRVQSRDIKFSKRIKKLRDLAQTKNTYSQKETTLDDTSELFPLTKIRPRFYQHINLSQEQIDLKRRKFDSQFIVKKSTLPATNIQITDKQGTESQVTEDICKMDNSKSIAPIQDTLERGIQQHPHQGQQQSLSLCESVYQ